MKRLLILSCSQRKLTDKKEVPAIDRYDGPSFRLLRRYLKSSAEDLQIYILSAKFGLIEHTARIPFYDQKVTNSRSEQLTATVRAQAESLLPANHRRKSSFVNLGKDYWQIFEPVFESVPLGAETFVSSGSSGRRLAEMYDWLYGEKSDLRNNKSVAGKEKEVFIRGVRLQTTESKIRTIIQNEIKQNKPKNFQTFQSWFVPIDNLKISPKWLVSRLTGLPVSKFHSDQARKALQNLGIKVKRV